MSADGSPAAEGRLAALARFLERWLAPLVDLAIRLLIARVFFFSGLVKVNNWDTTVTLFTTLYKVPLLPPEVAALLAAGCELSMPVLLVLGLAARLAALPLLAMALVIQFVLGAENPDFDKIEHLFWMVLLLAIVARGPGRLSLDHLIARRFGRRG